MTAKEYLSQIRKLEQSIRWYDTEIDRNRLSLLPGAVRYDTDRVQTSPEDKLAAVAVRIEELRLKQMQKRQELSQLRDKIVAELMTINAKRAEVLYLRYVRGMRYERIALTLTYSVDHVKRLHGWGLKEFERKVIRKQ